VPGEKILQKWGDLTCKKQARIVKAEQNGAKIVFLYTVAVVRSLFGVAISISSCQRFLRLTRIQKIPFGEQTNLTYFIIFILCQLLSDLLFLIA